MFAFASRGVDFERGKGHRWEMAVEVKVGGRGESGGRDAARDPEGLSQRQ